MCAVGVAAPAVVSRVRLSRTTRTATGPGAFRASILYLRCGSTTKISHGDHAGDSWRATRCRCLAEVMHSRHPRTCARDRRQGSDNICTNRSPHAPRAVHVHTHAVSHAKATTHIIERTRERHTTLTSLPTQAYIYAKANAPCYSRLGPTQLKIPAARPPAGLRSWPREGTSSASPMPAVRRSACPTAHHFADGS